MSKQGIRVGHPTLVAVRGVYVNVRNWIGSGHPLVPAANA
jgi:hypothetical protein